MMKSQFLMAAPNGIVLEAVSEENYPRWSVLVKNYLRGEGLWNDVVENLLDEKNNDKDGQKEDGKALHEDQQACGSSEHSRNNDKENWQGKDAKALHAIQLACGSEHLSKITKCETAKDAWNTLKSSFSPGSNVDPNDEAGAGRTADENYKKLLGFVEKGDVKGVTDCIDRNPRITDSTVIHVAVMAGNVEIVKALVKDAPEHALETEDEDGYTAIALVAAFTGNKHVAESLIKDKNKGLLGKKASNCTGAHKDLIPLLMAAAMGHEELTLYLFDATPPLVLEEGNHKYAALLFHKCINSELFDVAEQLIKSRYASKYLPLNYRGSDGMTPLHALAQMPSAFPSGNQFSLCQHWIYNNLKVIDDDDSQSRLTIRITPSPVNSIETQTKTLAGNLIALSERWCGLLPNLAPLKILGALLRRFQHYLCCCPAVERIYQRKLLHRQVRAILKCMCKRISTFNRLELREVSAYDAMLQAAKNGIIEFIELMRDAKPELLWESIDQNKRGIFAHAILHRRQKVFELIHELHGRKKKITCSTDRFGNSLLHLAAMLGPSSDLDQRCGAALQMQRELQWFKAVEDNMHPKFKKDTNNDGKKPQEVFAQSHKELVKEAEKWAKDTARSFIIVGTLIITIIFAAAFTLPGGNDQNTGKPMFLKDKIFTVFIMADAFALFSSCSSVLIFIGVLTSRYAEKDFLRNLPRKLLFGLVTLSLSVVFMLAAFCAAFFMMLRGIRGYSIVSWISMVLAVVTVLLALLPSHYRLFSEIFCPNIGFKPIRVEKKNPSHRICDCAMSTLKRCIGY